MAERTYPICANEVCARPMRPRGAAAEAFPGTVAMGHKGQCKTCVQPRVRARRERPVQRRNSAEERVTYAASGLQSFLARRYARGIPPEATPSFPSRTVLADVIVMPAPADRELVAA
jgi:hypothetical protein